MADVFDENKRSQVMALIRGKNNKSTELKLVVHFKAAGIKGWRRHVQLKPLTAVSDPVKGARVRVLIKPDFIFRAYKIAIFVDGCFWHGCPQHSRLPRSNEDFWKAKLSNNVMRDERSKKALEAADWKVVRIWEHEMKDPKSVVARISHILDQAELGNNFR